MASSATILEWLKEAGAYAEKREDLVGISGMLIDIVVGPHALGVRVRRPDQREFRSILWEELELADSNPIPAVIDATIEAVEKQGPIDLRESEGPDGAEGFAASLTGIAPAH
jgi:hypothetical protein